ncbi:hypothetical protein ACIFOT_03030 [Neobacillus sp. NRS-1170]|uniref:hypothetical protein n=1 Tax=Neobacillus sp. NRS-1170 TaxID=3233898 RepID=UPI003D28E576
MRFLYKRPKMKLIDEEINDVLEVMSASAFIYLDLLVFSLIFTLLLVPVLHSIGLSILFFIACFILFSSLYYFVFTRILK